VCFGQESKITSFRESVRFGQVGGKPQDHGMATDLAVVVEFARLLLRRWNHHLEELVATRALDLHGFHGVSVDRIAVGWREKSSGIFAISGDFLLFAVVKISTRIG
jgi:hypothetical protein